MKENLSCVIAFLCCSLSTMAQPLKIGLSASLGNAMAKQTIAGSIESRPFTIAAPGCSFGAQIRSALARKLYGSAGVHYNISRLHNEFSWQPRFRAVINNNFHQVQLPLLVHYTIFDKWSVGTGIVPQFFLAGRQTSWFAANDDELQLTRNSTGGLSRKFTLPLRAQVSLGLNEHWGLFFHYDVLPGGHFKDPNYNNQIYGTAHQLQCGTTYSF